jgi:hypothetical protein
MGDRRVRYVVASCIAILIIVLCAVVIPRVLVPSLSERSLSNVPDSKDRIQLESDRIRLQNDVRTSLFQGLAGALLIFGAVAAWWQTQISRQQLLVVQEGQITERFTRAVDQLGSEKVDVRLGGIYALERIAKNSAADQSVVVEVLAAFVREHAPLPPARRTARIAQVWASLRLRLGREPDHEWGDLPTLRFRIPDVQAAMTVLGRRTWPVDPQLLWTSHADLRRAHLPDANFEGGNFFAGNLYGAQLQYSNLRGAGLSEVILERAALQGADLRGARLRGARLHGAFASDDTLWPVGFDPLEAGVIIEVDSSPAQPITEPVPNRVESADG